VVGKLISTSTATSFSCGQDEAKPDWDPRVSAGWAALGMQGGQGWLGEANCGLDQSRTKLVRKTGPAKLFLSAINNEVSTSVNTELELCLTMGFPST
jgi:hypothetical protein